MQDVEKELMAEAELAQDSSPWHTPLSFHAERDRLFNELHTRPFPVLPTPARLSQFAIVHEDLSPEVERQHLLLLCDHYSTLPPPEGASCYYQDFGSFEFRWERHAEFSTYTFLTTADDNQPFSTQALDRVPPAWLQGLPRQILSGIHIEIQSSTEVPEDRELLRQSFEGQRLMSSQVLDRQAELWTSYRLQKDGFVRFLVRNKGMNPCQTGRLARTVLELETYRMMLLLGLPLAKKLTPDLRQMEEQLVKITGQINRLEDLEDERRVLAQLSDLAARTEQMLISSKYRFDAGAAYYALIKSRLEELRESEQRGLMTLSEFLKRRISPAYRTGEAVSKNLEDLAERIDRSSEMLRTRVNLQIEAQNQKLLHSMDERSHRQLRLQQAVEGLSVAAITYYSVGLFKYLLDALAAHGMDIPKAGVLGVAVPAVLMGSWLGLRALKRSLSDEPGA